MHAQSLPLCLTPCSPMKSLPGSSVPVSSRVTNVRAGWEVKGSTRAGCFVPSEGCKLGVITAHEPDLSANVTRFGVRVLSARAFLLWGCCPAGCTCPACLPGASLLTSAPPHLSVSLAPGITEVGFNRPPYSRRIAFPVQFSREAQKGDFVASELCGLRGLSVILVGQSGPVAPSQRG